MDKRRERDRDEPGSALQGTGQASLDELMHHSGNARNCAGCLG